MRPFGILFGAVFGLLALPTVVYLNPNYTFATAQLADGGPYAAKIALLVLALLAGLAALILAVLALPFRRARPFAVSFVLAFFFAGGIGSFLQGTDPGLISGLLNLPAAV